MHSCSDPIGSVITIRGGKAYRLINPSAQEHTKKLLKSGLITELIQANLFPNTKIADPETINQLQIKRDFCMVLEHDALPQTRPSQWTPEMIASACKVILEVNTLANKYSYSLKDGHLWNVLFNGTNPVFVDFGSFMPLPSSRKMGFAGAQEFVSSSIVPLHLYENNESLIAHSFLSNPHYPYGSIIPLSSQLVEKTSHKYLNIEISLGSGIRICLPFNLIVLKVMRKLLRANAVPVLSHAKSMSLLQRSISRLQYQNQASTWQGYQDEYETSTSTRFKRIISEFLLIDHEKRKTVLDLAGNQGLFASKLLVNSAIQQLIVADSDINALGTGFRRELLKNKNINFVAVNFIDILYEQHLASLLKSDVVFALALVHHLTLGQGLCFYDVARGLSNVVKSFLIVEFMPFGLWGGGDSALPDVPKWYCLDNFLQALTVFFDISCEPREIDENRILIICSPKGAAEYTEK